MVGELSFCDVTHKADMSRSGLAREAAVEAAKIAAVPGATEQRGELAGSVAQGVENGGELLREQEETAVGTDVDRQRMQDGVKCGRAVVTRCEDQSGSASARRLEIWRQLVPLRALLDSPTRTTKRLIPWRVAPTRQ